MWVIKTHGVTMYVNHVSAEIPWSTKETPGNERTKGSIKFKKCKLTVDTEDNTATISRLGVMDAWLKPPTRRAGRILFPVYGDMNRALASREFEHSRIKEVQGACGSSWAICDLLDEQELTMAALKYAGKFRILAPNEAYYQDYDKKGEIWERDDDENYQEDYGDE